MKTKTKKKIFRHSGLAWLKNIRERWPDGKPAKTVVDHVHTWLFGQKEGEK